MYFYRVYTSETECRVYFETLTELAFIIHNNYNENASNIDFKDDILK